MGDGKVKLTNTDPRLIEMFCLWLRAFFDIDESRLRAHLYLHQGLDLEEAILYWSRITRIPPGQFIKPYRAEPDPAIKKAKHEFGCIAVHYCCSRTHRGVMGLVAGLLGAPVTGC